MDSLDFGDTYTWSILLKIFRYYEPGRSRLTHDHLFKPVRVFDTVLRTVVLTEAFAKALPITLCSAFSLAQWDNSNYRDGMETCFLEGDLIRAPFVSYAVPWL